LKDGNLSKNFSNEKEDALNGHTKTQFQSSLRAAGSMPVVGSSCKSGQGRFQQVNPRVVIIAPHLADLQ
jgi:hypothetical protein